MSQLCRGQWLPQPQLLVVSDLKWSPKVLPRTYNRVWIHSFAVVVTGSKPSLKRFSKGSFSRTEYVNQHLCRCICWRCRRSPPDWTLSTELGPTRPLFSRNHTEYLFLSWNTIFFCLLSQILGGDYMNIPANIFIDVSFVAKAPWTGFLHCIVSWQFKSIFFCDPRHEAGCISGNNRVFSFGILKLNLQSHNQNCNNLYRQTPE